MAEYQAERYRLNWDITNCLTRVPTPDKDLVLQAVKDVFKERCKIDIDNPSQLKEVIAKKFLRSIIEHLVRENWHSARKDFFEKGEAHIKIPKDIKAIFNIDITSDDRELYMDVYIPTSDNYYVICRVYSIQYLDFVSKRGEYSPIYEYEIAWHSKTAFYHIFPITPEDIMPVISSVARHPEIGSRIWDYTRREVHVTLDEFREEFINALQNSVQQYFSKFMDIQCSLKEEENKILYTCQAKDKHTGKEGVIVFEL